MFWHKKAKNCEVPNDPVVRTLLSLPTAHVLSLVRGYPKWSEVAKKKKKMKIEDLPLEMYKPQGILWEISNER